MSGYAEFLLSAGYAVLMPDARAHGESGGTVATHGWLEREDIHQWLNWLTEHKHPHCIFGLGESMGAAQLLQALPGSRFCAVAAESSFSSFREIAYDRVGQFFNTGPWLGRTLFRPLIETAFWYTHWRYDLPMSQISPENAVRATNIAILLIHGENDRNIPVRHSQRLEAANPRIQLWEVPGTDHCGGVATHPNEFKARLLAWFASHDR
jgi:pimeloyl-ACP methyl ester carboxylesterase